MSDDNTSPASAGVPVSVASWSPLTQVYSGHLFPLLAPQPELVRIDDIAAALSKICRFGGHVRQFYSVAQHCVLVSRIVPPDVALWGLLHDAPEAYVGDLTRPLKMALYSIAPGALARIEAPIADAIATRFGLDLRMPAAVRRADDVALATERRDLMAPSQQPWPGLPDPLPDRIEPLGPDEAHQLFLDRFHVLAGGGV